jgi:hypothetical protein
MDVLTYSTRPHNLYQNALVAQLDRVLGYEPSGRRFESSRVRHIIKPAIRTVIFNSKYFVFLTDISSICKKNY